MQRSKLLRIICVWVMIHLELSCSNWKERGKGVASINNRLSSRNTVNKSFYADCQPLITESPGLKNKRYEWSGCVQEAETKSAVCRDRAVQSLFVTEHNHDEHFSCHHHFYIFFQIASLSKNKQKKTTH